MGNKMISSVLQTTGKIFWRCIFSLEECRGFFVLSCFVVVFFFLLLFLKIRLVSGRCLLRSLATLSTCPRWLPASKVGLSPSGNHDTHRHSEFSLKGGGVKSGKLPPSRWYYWECENGHRFLGSAATVWRKFLWTLRSKWDELQGNMDIRWICETKQQ